MMVDSGDGQSKKSVPRDVPRDKELTAVPIRTFAGLADIGDEWAALMGAARPGSPFVHPAWAITWARHYLTEGQLECVAVREGGPDGRLIGMAPFYRKRIGRGRLGLSYIVPFGVGQGEALTEVVQLVALPAKTQAVLRAVVQHLNSLGDTWVQMSVAPDQGWLLPQWIGGPGGATIAHLKTRPCVVIDDLPDDPDMLLSTLKRNVRESIRRCRNRSKRLGEVNFCQADEPEEISAVLPRLIDLHRSRSRLTDRVRHTDMLQGKSEEFLRDAAVRMAGQGLARVHYAEHRGTPVAAQLVLSSEGSDYMSITGMDPDYWSLSLNTMLIFEAIKVAIAAGRTSVNLSTGPNEAKMRWSSRVLCYNDFTIVPQRRSSQLAHDFFVHLGWILEDRNDRRAHRVTRADQQASPLGDRV